jgi:hypothetical protein
LGLDQLMRIKRTALAVGAGVVWIGLMAAIGHYREMHPPAPENPEQSFINSVADQGLLGQPADKLLHLGRLVCIGAHSGMDDNEIVQQIRPEGALNSHQADIVRVAAELHLCDTPGYQ